MNIPLYSKIAIRYIALKKSFSFITVINFISTIGIVIGVAALIIVMSIFYGFQKLTEEQMIAFDPHLIIDAEEDIIDEINNNLTIDNLLSKAIVINSKGVLIKDEKLSAVNINLYDNDNKSHLLPLAENILMGNFYFPKNNSIVLGFKLASTLDVMPGDTITLVSPAQLERSFITFSSFPGTQVIVEGIFRSNLRDYDDSYIFASHDLANKILGNKYTKKVEMRLIDIDKINNTIDIITKEKQNLEITTWMDLNRDLFNIMRLERLSSFIVLSLIILIAVFNVLASLNMTVIEKKSDIGILRSMGANDRFIKNIFIIEGLIIGMVGTFLGTVLGLGFCYAQINYELFSLDSGKYIVSAIPLIINYTDVFFVIAISIVLSITSTIYPAKKAASINVIEAVRSE